MNVLSQRNIDILLFLDLMARKIKSLTLDVFPERLKGEWINLYGIESNKFLSMIFFVNFRKHLSNYLFIDICSVPWNKSKHPTSSADKKRTALSKLCIWAP